jgi:transcriptional regulator with XRE-family HTH domain
MIEHSKETPSKRGNRNPGLGDILKRVRKNAGLTQKDISLLLGSDLASYNAIEGSRLAITSHQLRVFAHFFNLEYSALVNLEVKYREKKVNPPRKLSPSNIKRYAFALEEVRPGKLIKKVREDHGLSHEQLAIILKIKKETLIPLESDFTGARVFTVEKLKLFVEYFDLSLESFLNGQISYLDSKNLFRKQHVTPAKGSFIKRIREEFGVTQVRLAEILDIDQGFLSRVEKNKSKINISNLKTLSAHFGLELESLAHGEIKRISPESSITSNCNYQDFDPVRLGETLKKARKDSKIKQRQIAELLNCDQGIISRIEKGQCRRLSFDIEKLLKLTNFLRLDFEAFLNYEIRYKSKQQANINS